MALERKKYSGHPRSHRTQVRLAATANTPLDTNPDSTMLTIQTDQGEYRLTRDFAPAVRELHRNAILGVVQGELSLLMSTTDALKIANDKSTDFSRAAIILWLLKRRSSHQNMNPADRRALAEADDKFRLRMKSVKVVITRGPIQYESDSNENN